MLGEILGGRDLLRVREQPGDQLERGDPRGREVLRILAGGDELVEEGAPELEDVVNLKRIGEDSGLAYYIETRTDSPDGVIVEFGLKRV